MAAEEDVSSVKVAVRVRPMNDREKKGNTLPVVTAATDKKEVVLIRGAGNRQLRATYNFDAVLMSVPQKKMIAFSPYKKQAIRFPPTFLSSNAPSLRRLRAARGPACSL